MAPILPLKVFIVIDPSQDQHVALERTLYTAQHFHSVNTAVKRELQLFFAVDFDNTDTSADNPNMYQSTDAFMDLIAPLEAAGLKFKIQCSWSTDWYDSILKASREFGADLIMLPQAVAPLNLDSIFNGGIWRLMRTAPCPVLIVRPGDAEQRKVILAAVNFQSHKEEYHRLNELIIKRGQWLATMHNAELHIVNAYKDSLHYPDRAKLANETKVSSENIHVEVGVPQTVITDVAEKINADVVVIGTQKRSSRWKGNTADKIMNRIKGDILAIN